MKDFFLASRRVHQTSFYWVLYRKLILLIPMVISDFRLSMLKLSYFFSWTRKKVKILSYLELKRNGEESDDDIGQSEICDEIICDSLHATTRQYDANHQTVAWKVKCHVLRWSFKTIYDQIICDSFYATARQHCASHQTVAWKVKCLTFFLLFFFCLLSLNLCRSLEIKVKVKIQLIW